MTEIRLALHPQFRPAHQFPDVDSKFWHSDEHPEGPLNLTTCKVNTSRDHLWVGGWVCCVHVAFSSSFHLLCVSVCLRVILCVTRWASRQHWGALTSERQRDVNMRQWFHVDTEKIESRRKAVYTLTWWSWKRTITHTQPRGKSHNRILIKTASTQTAAAAAVSHLMTVSFLI